MKHILISLLMLMLALAARAEDPGFTIPVWTYDAMVRGNGTIEVTESITADFSVSSHGLFRFIPRVFYYEGIRYEVTIDDIDVKKWDYITYSNTEDNPNDEQDNLVVRIGSADSYVLGKQTYEISYVMQAPYDRRDEKDFFYHSLLGSEVPTTIDSFIYNITFEEALPEDVQLHSHFLIGKYGSTVSKSVPPFSADRKSISGVARNIQPYTAYTVFIELPEGTYGPDTPPNYTGALLLFLLLLVVGAVWLIRILRIRKGAPVPVVTFYPPKDISSAEVGTIIDNSADLIDLTSLIPWFASKGYITIKEVKKKDGKTTTLELTKANPLPDKAPLYQKTFMSTLFAGKAQTVRLDKLGNKHNKIDKALNQLDGRFTGKEELVYTSNLAFYIMIYCLAFMLLHGINSFDRGIDLAMLIVGGLIFCVPLGISILYNLAEAANEFVTNGLKYARITTVVCMVVSLAANHILSDYPDYATVLPAYLTDILLVIAYVMAFFSSRTVVDTPYRLGLMGELIGLKEFINTAEKDRLKMLVDDNPEYFYDILPYALVFGLSDKWAKQFAEIDMPAPDWYDAYDRSNMAGYLYADRISRSISGVAYQTLHVSSQDVNAGGAGGRSSSFGGRVGGGSSIGFSGGGVGGGGVGRW